MLKRAFCKFHKDCYFSSEIRRKGREKANILRGKSGLLSYCIMLSESDEEQLEIVHSAFLRSKEYRRRVPVIWGVAKTRFGAIEVVTRMMEDAARAGYPGDARTFLISRQQKEKRRHAFGHPDNS